MKRVLFTTLTFWVLLLSPVLCLAGVLEHLCADCPERTSCDHEEDCVSDPCVDIVQVPDTASHASGPARTVVLDPRFIAPLPGLFESPPLSLTADLRTRGNLPRPESDLPLLI